MDAILYWNDAAIEAGRTTHTRSRLTRPECKVRPAAGGRW
jgi:hypothetical protein